MNRGSSVGHIGPTLLDKAAGCLAGVAVGDAMGMPVEFMTREEIRARFGRVEGFLAPPAGHLHAGKPAGRVTDDTEQTWAIARALIGRGRITPAVAAAAYLGWAEETGAFQSTFLGPSSRRALERLRRGEDPGRTGEEGSTIGAAMRVAPIGIANAGDPEAAAEEAYLSALPTHGVNIAIAAACAVAAGVAQAVAGASLEGVLAAMAAGAELGQSRGVAWAGATVPARLSLALALVRRGREEKAGADRIEADLYGTVGVGMCPTELAATAAGLVAAYDGDPRLAIPAAASMGGDADTLASIVGALTGALRGIAAFPPRWVEEVEEVNRLDCRNLAAQLVALAARRQGSSPNTGGIGGTTR